MAALLVVACGGEKAGDRGWLKSGRTEVSGTVVRVFRRAGGKMLECLGQNRTSGKPDDVAAVQAGLEGVCLSMKPK